MRLLQVVVLFAPLLVSSLPATAVEPSTLRLRLEARGSGAAMPEQVRVLLTEVGKSIDHEVERTVPAGGHVVLPVPGAGEWSVCVTADGFWAPCRRVVVQDGAAVTQAAVELWPSGRVGGTLRLAPVPDHEKETPELPEQVTVRFASTGRDLILTGAGRSPGPPSDGGPAGEVECGVQPPAEGEGVASTARWSCSLPAGILDVVVRPGAFVPAYRWAVKVPAGDGELDLGVQELRRGASVVGAVAMEEGAFEPERVTVRLVPRTSRGLGARGAQRLSQWAEAVAVDARGFFQAAGVRPGAYVVVAEQPGRASGRSGAVEVLPGFETVLPEPVVLRRPVTIRLQIAPPADWMGKPWTVGLAPAPDFGGLVDTSMPEERPTGEEGVASFPGRPPGVYSVQVRDAAGQSFHLEPALRIEGAADAEHRIEIPLVMVEGTVRLGDEPLQASLWFGGRHGAQQAEMASDEEGRFVGALPRPGKWTVEVEAAEPVISRQVRVEVEDTGESALDIRLPDTHLFGNVVRDDGRAVPGAAVTVQSGGVGHRAVADPDGAFELRAVDPGHAAVGASKESGEERLDSDTLLLVVDEEQSNGPVIVRMRPVRSLAGQVLSAGGEAVAGALVEVSTHRPVTAMFHAGARSEIDGSFEVQVRSDVELLQAVVSAPGQALTVLRTQPAAPLVLRPQAEGGTLVLRLPSPEASADYHLLLFYEDLSLPLTSVVRWARVHEETVRDGVLRVPRIASGPYRVCLGSMAEITRGLAETGDWTRHVGGCDGGYLAPGGELFLEARARSGNPERSN